MKILAAFLLSLFASPAVPATPREAGVKASTVKDGVVGMSVHIKGVDCIGSGVCIRHKGEVFILTAAHVVGGCFVERTRTFTDESGEERNVKDRTPLPVTCRWKDGREMDARPVWFSKDWKEAGPDLALLRPDSQEGLTGADLLPAGDAVEDGEDCWYCGSGAGLPFGLERSIISRQDRRYLVTNGCGWYGHSGSGLFVRRGGGGFALAGIVTQFCIHPSKHTKSPIEAERQLREFLGTYDKRGK